MSGAKNQKMVVRLRTVAVLFLLPIIGVAQTSVTMPKNKYKIQDDIDLGRKTSVQVEQQFPILNDADAESYVQRVGQRLVANIPPQFQQSAFQYRFKVVNASDINAFALPGGPMYVNRGMIQAAKNEGEMAGVMAHEISHVALRHATAQATKQSSAGSVLGQLGLIIGGAILGGQAGAQAGAIAAAVWQTKYSREFETQADILGSQIMARAGYDPRDLANMFQTIASQREGGRVPEWISSHPDPGNRYQKINQEATRLSVSPNPIKVTRDFERVRADLASMPPALTMAQIEQNYKNGQSGSSNGMGNGSYSSAITNPSRQTRQYTAGNVFRVNVPTNWQEFTGNSEVTFAPRGAFGSQGITHGVMAGVFQNQGYDLRSATDTFVRNLIQNNSYLRERNGATNAYIGSYRGYSSSLLGRSPVTGRNEVVTIYTAQMRDGRIFYLATVVPQNETYRYDQAFQAMISSVELN